MRMWNKYSAALALAGAIGCSSGPGTTTDAGTVDAGDMDSGMVDAGPLVYTKTTVQNAVAMASTTLKDQPVEIDNAVVVAAYNFLATTGNQEGTFYIQDGTGTNGIPVFHGKNDTSTFPALGDVVNVQGKLAFFDGSLQISSSLKYNIPENITIVSHNATAPGNLGAEPPVGTPVMIPSSKISTDYAHSVPDSAAHPDLVGQVIQFSGPLDVTVQYPTGFVVTKADGGQNPQGFEVNAAGADPSKPGMWVYDADTYYDCMRNLGPDGGTLYPTLTNGIRGVWDRYQDYGGGSMAPIYPVLVPMGCSDFLQSDGGTDAGTVTDAGTTDAGSVDAGATDAGTAADAGAADSGS